MALFPHIDVDGTRLTEVVDRLGVRKQSPATLVKDLVEWRLLERVADPADRRAKKICFAGGEGAHARGVERLIAFEPRLRDELGAETTDALQSALIRFEDTLTQ
jgi:hypothetical protein